MCEGANEVNSACPSKQGNAEKFSSVRRKEMMGQGFTDGMMRSIMLGIVILVLLSLLIGALSMWLLPKLWIFLKPIIHEITG